jgi:hypothetical protein
LHGAGGKAHAWQPWPGLFAGWDGSETGCGTRRVWVGGRGQASAQVECSGRGFLTHGPKDAAVESDWLGHVPMAPELPDSIAVTVGLIRSHRSGV